MNKPIQRGLSALLVSVSLCAFAVDGYSTVRSSEKGMESGNLRKIYAASREMPKTAKKTHLKSERKAAAKASSEKKKSTEGKPSKKTRCLIEDLPCMATCLYRNVSPELIQVCAEACGNQQWAQCAVCLQVGATILAACLIECYLIE